MSEGKGRYGTSIRLEMPDVPEAEETVCSWLITASVWHPAWDQYLLGVVRLRDLPGWPPPIRHFRGATHELFVATLDPASGPYGADIVSRYMITGNLPILSPINIAHQIEGTDAEAEELAGLAVQAVLDGVLEPESSNGPDRIRAAWKSSMVKTLAHIRGEEHAS